MKQREKGQMFTVCATFSALRRLVNGCLDSLAQKSDFTTNTVKQFVL